MIKNTGLTFEQHKQLGTELADIRQSLLVLVGVLSHVYPSKNRGYVLAGRSLHLIDHLRCAMDSNLFMDCGHINGSELQDVYYPRE